MEIINDIFSIYAKLCGYKFRETLNATKFAKLASLPGMTI